MPSPKSAETSVVKFSPKSAGRAPRYRKRTAGRPDHPDANLIQACLDCAYATGGIKEAFHADPTGNSDFAQPMDERALRTARKSVNFAANYSPSTIDGLRAKAAIVRMVLEIESDTESAAPFFKSLADDIRRLCRDLAR